MTKSIPIRNELIVKENLRLGKYELVFLLNKPTLHVMFSDEISSDRPKRSLPNVKFLLHNELNIVDFFLEFLEEIHSFDRNVFLCSFPDRQAMKCEKHDNFLKLLILQLNHKRLKYFLNEKVRRFFIESTDDC